MKKYFYLTFAAAVLFAAGCGKGEFFPGPTLNIGEGAVITSPADASAIVLLEAQAADTFRIKWTEADFGFSAAATYTVEVDRAGNDFANAVTVGSSTSLELVSSVAKLNTVLFIALGLQGEVASDIEMRLKVTISSEVPEVYSAPISLSVTPYTIVIVYPKLQVPGSYQGWNPMDNTTVIYSAGINDEYEGYIYFPDPNTEFKYTNGTTWDLAYGDIGSDGILDSDNGATNIKATDPGLYRLNVNLGNLTHTYAKYSWGIIGDATPTGWGSDTDMIYDAAGNKLTVTLDLVPGSIRFRVNDTSTVDLGDNDANGSLEYGGDDIAVAEAGNYTIDLILSGAIYTYKLKKN